MFARCFFFQAEDGIRYLVRSRGLGDVYKRQVVELLDGGIVGEAVEEFQCAETCVHLVRDRDARRLSLIHI